MRTSRNYSFDNYIGIDYSGSGTSESGLAGLAIYAAERLNEPVPQLPPSGRRRWSRREIAQWLVEELSRSPDSLVGIDHSFSFPLEYFDKYRLPLDWDSFLDDFQLHWPTDEAGATVEMIRRGERGAGELRNGNSRWRRRSEALCRAKSVFHFDVPGSVAKSTHAGIPWLRQIRRANRGIFFWPFDGWSIPSGRPVIVETYPALWSRMYPQEDRTDHQHDAYTIAAHFRNLDEGGSLDAFFSPALSSEERLCAGVEGWIFGVGGSSGGNGGTIIGSRNNLLKPML